MKKDRIRRNTLPRKSKLAGRLERLRIRQDNMGPDMPGAGLHVIRPGSMKG